MVETSNGIGSSARGSTSGTATVSGYSGSFSADSTTLDIAYSAPAPTAACLAAWM